MRKPPKVDPTAPAALSAWLVEARDITAKLHELTIDATAPKAQRQKSRTHLRTQTRRCFQILSALLSAVDPAAPPPADGHDGAVPVNMT